MSSTESPKRLPLSTRNRKAPSGKRKTLSGRRKAQVCLLAVVSLWAAACDQRSDRIVLKLGHALDQKHPVHHGMVHMAELVETRSGGRVQIEIYPSEQLGPEKELLELLQLGSIAIAKVGGMVLESFQPSMGAFSLPYLFPDEESFWRILQGEIGRQLLEEGSAFGFKGLCYYDSGSRSFYTRERPIHGPEDLRGLKIRVPKSATSMEMIRSLGGSATPAAFGELYSALQQGVVDGAENNPPSFYLSRHFEVCRYYTLDEHSRVPDVLVGSQEVWDELPLDVQKLIEDAAWDSMDRQRQLWRESVNDCMRDLKAAGVEIIRPDIVPFMEAVGPLLDRYEREKEYGDLVARIRKEARKASE